MATRAIIRNRQKEGEYVCTSQNFGFKKAAALNSWYWGPRITATTFDSPGACRSEDIEYGDISIDGDEASQECRCLICDACLFTRLAAQSFLKC